jgi:hypothetical protein
LRGLEGWQSALASILRDACFASSSDEVGDIFTASRAAQRAAEATTFNAGGIIAMSPCGLSGQVRTVEPAPLRIGLEGIGYSDTDSAAPSARIAIGLDHPGKAIEDATLVSWSK